MTLADRVTLRAVVLPAESMASSRAEKLLSEYGHDVANARTPEQALELLQEEEADLLVVDVSNSNDNKSFIHRLAEMPVGVRPRNVVVFADRADESLSALRRRLRWHVLFKPLHLHGLLSVLRQLDGAGELAKA